MAFEVYIPRSSNDNKVALTKHHIRLGNGMIKHLTTDRVEVAYDRSSGKLRIKSVEDGGIKLSKNKIGAQGIFKYFDLREKKGTYPAEYNEKEKAIYVNLSTQK